jgi:Carboxypeptidase regulatory-like domain
MSNRSARENGIVLTGYRRLSIATLLAILFFPSMAPAQIRAGTVTGTVVDSSKAVVPGASVIVTNEATNVATELVTNDAGVFTAPYLPAGSYTVRVSLPGFATFVRNGIALASTETVRVTVELTVAQASETVTVAAEVPLLQTDRTSVSGAVGAEMIEALPNITQNPLQYAMLQAGAIGRNSTQDTTGLNSFGIGVDGRRNWSAVGINGGRAFTNDIQLDGLPVMGGGYNEAAVVPNTEGLQEVRVISNNFSAEYGRGQAVISMATKSGTNAFHGNGVYLMRNEHLDANTFSNNAQGIAKRQFRVNDIGGAIGGPIRKNSVFFFSSYHGLRNNQESTTLATVPTALERVGNFSQTFIRDENGNPVPARVFDPFNVVQEGPDLYRRVEIPNAIIARPNPATVQMFSFYPLPNRTPDDVFNTNNFEASTVQTVRRHSSNNRVDWRVRNHSIYASGGISYATITTPRPFGQSPFNGADGIRSDNNPYFQVGDSIVLSRSLVVDVRYGLSHIDTKAFTGDKEGFTDFNAFGVPANLQPLMAFREAAPVVNPNGFNGGSGGGSNWTALSAGTFGTKLEVQSNHSFAGSVTKIRGRWTHKAGTEYRNLLSHYADPEQASVAIPSPTAHTGGNFNFEYVTANGSAAQQTRINAQRGVNGAALLLGAGLWTIRPGANVLPYFAQKYFAIYSQNDWRPMPNLTVNLGLRWELQPGPTERENRMSAWDFTRMNPFGTQGAVAFPGMEGYGRNLWDTEYNDWGPRVGAAYSLNKRTVIRGGFGITYLPSNTGYFSGPTDYGSANFSGGVSQIPYGTDPRGVVVGSFSDPSPVVAAVGGDPNAPQVYGIGESRFTRQFENGRSTQWNVFVERSIRSNWNISAGYTASLSRHLLNRSFPIQNLQSIDSAVLASWREQYIASNGTINPATQLVPNPFQPSSGPLLPFAGVLGAATITRQTTLFPYPLLVPGIVNSSDASADYHAMQLRVSRRFSRGMALDATYTWSKNLEDTNTGIEDGQGFNAGGTATNWDIKNRKNNRMLGLSDVPHRFVSTFLYEIPLSIKSPSSTPMRVVKAIAGDWQVGGTLIWQAGFPISISGASTGAALARPDRVDGADLLLPKALWGWYDGRTPVTLPSGRVITPPNRTYLKYNPDAFVGRVVRTPNGSIVADQYWYGNASQTYDEFRTDPRFNIDISLRRKVPIAAYSLEVGVDVMNLLNHAQFNGAYTGNLGGTTTTANPALGLVAGMGNANNFGTRGMGTFNPRQMMLRATLRF